MTTQNDIGAASDFFTRRRQHQSPEPQKTPPAVSVLSVHLKRKNDSGEIGTIANATVRAGELEIRCRVVRDLDGDLQVIPPNSAVKFPDELEFQIEEAVLAAYANELATNSEVTPAQKGTTNMDTQSQPDGYRVTKLKSSEGLGEFGSDYKPRTTSKPKDVEKPSLAKQQLPVKIPPCADTGYSGFDIQVTRLKPTVGKPPFVATCMVTVAGAIKLLEVVLCSEFEEYRLIMPRRAMGGRTIPAVELSRELTADVKRVVVKSWLEHCAQAAKAE